MSVNNSIGFASQRGTLGVADSHYLGALFFGVPGGHKSVHGFTGLADGNNQSVGGENRIAVAELVS